MKSAGCFSRRRCLSPLIFPMLPMICCGVWMARKPTRINESVLIPLSAKSMSVRKIFSSKPRTCWRNWLLMPQTKKSPKGGRTRSKMAGRGLRWPSAWGRGTRRTSPSVIGTAEFRGAVRWNNPVPPPHRRGLNQPAMRPARPGVHQPGNRRAQPARATLPPAAMRKAHPDRFVCRRLTSWTMDELNRRAIQLPEINFFIRPPAI